MNPKLAEVTQIPIKEVKREESTVMWEVLTYLGSSLILGGISLIMYQKWDSVTQSQKTATFAIVAIAFFVVGLLAGDTEDIRRRVSGFFYVLSAASAGASVYVTFPKDLAPFRSLVLAAVIALFGYTISQTVFGHIALFATTTASIVALVFENVKSTDLRTYTGTSLVIAFSLFWIVLAAVDTVERDLGLALGMWTFFMASQAAFAENFHTLAYSIGIGIIATCLWLYTRVASWVLIVSGLITFVICLGEFVLESLDGSIGAALGLLAIGAVTAILSVRTISEKRTRL